MTVWQRQQYLIITQGRSILDRSTTIAFSSLLEQLGRRFQTPQVEHLMNIILRMSNDKIAKVVATTDARNVMNLELDKLAGSVRAVITAYTRNFKHLALPTGPRFSFRDWAHNEDSDAWVFITVRDDMKETLKPMMTMMLESAMSAILTLEPSEDRLIVTAIDEAGTLHEIPRFVIIFQRAVSLVASHSWGFSRMHKLNQLTEIRRRRY